MLARPLSRPMGETGWHGLARAQRNRPTVHCKHESRELWPSVLYPPNPLSPFGVNQGKGTAAGARPNDLRIHVARSRHIIRVVRSRRAKLRTIWGLKRGLSSVHGGTALVLGNASCRAGGENCAEGGAGSSPVWTVLAFPCVFSRDTASWAAPQRPSS